MEWQVSLAGENCYSSIAHSPGASLRVVFCGIKIALTRRPFCSFLGPFC